MLSFPTLRSEARPLPLFGQARRIPAPKVAISMDIDDTLVRWGNWSSQPDEVGLAQTVKILQENRNRLVSILNTGRSLSYMQDIANVLKDVPVDYLVLNNGQEIYINRQGKRTDQWLASLTHGHQDRRWREAIRDVTGWDLKQVLLPRLKAFLMEEEGFSFMEQPPDFTLDLDLTLQRTSQDGESLMAVLVPDQSGIIFTMASGAFGAEHQAEANGIMARLVEALNALGVNAQSTGHYFSHSLERDFHRRFYRAWLSPQGITKASGLQRVLRREPSVKAVITAGDHGFNDTEMLTRPSYANRYHQRLPNYPILSGNDENGELAQRLTQKIARGSITYVESGRIGPAIEQQLQRLDEVA